MAAAAAEPRVERTKDEDPLPPTDAEKIALQFVGALDAKYRAADLAGLSMFYGDDSQLCFDGSVVPAGRAAIASALTARFAHGPVACRFGSTDAQVTPTGQAVVLCMGDSSFPATKFTQVFVLAPMAGGGMYVRGEIFRSAGTAGAAQVNAALDATGRGVALVQHYYAAYQSARPSLAALYAPVSQLKFEKKHLSVGAAAIAERQAAMPVGVAAVDTLDVLPLASNAFVVLVNGRFQIAGETNVLLFCHLFHVIADGTSTVITNEIFRFNYA